MPLPTSGPISLSMIRAEFGGTAPDSLSEYYAGAGLVPAGTSGTNGLVPSSGPISFSSFYGTSNVPPVNITDQFPSSLEDAGTATARYNLGADGVLRITQFNNAMSPVSGEWLTSGSASAYEARATLVGDPFGVGSFGGTALDTWVSLGSVDREWSISKSAFGAFTVELQIIIRRASDLVIVDIANVTLTAERIA